MNEQSSIQSLGNQNASDTTPRHFKIVTWIIAILYLFAGIGLMFTGVLSGIASLQSLTLLGILKILGIIAISLGIFALAWGMRKRFLWALYTQTILFILGTIILLVFYTFFLGMNIQTSIFSVLFNNLVGIIILIYLWLNRKWFK